MSDEILINFTPRETRVAVLQNGIVQELHIERAGSRGIVGNIYLGKIVRILPGMQSAFAEIGIDRTAFLHVGDIFVPREVREPREPGDARSESRSETRSETRNEESRPIERLLVDGQSVLVQAIKDPIGSKGARLSTQISLAGRMLVYLPQEKHIGVSQRIGSEEGRAALRARLTNLVPADEMGGFIVRTSAEAATDDELAADIDYLRKLWNGILDASRQAGPPALIHQDLSLAQRVVRDFVNGDTGRIMIDSRENFQKLLAFARSYTPKVVDLLSHYTGERPLFDLYGVEEEIDKALARRVELKSGGYLIFDQTEALTTIDVNTGAFVGHRNFHDTIFKTNLEAAQVIARQLRLRNLGGIIIVDFIDMQSAEHRDAVLVELNRALERDHTKVTVNGFTALGLAEMTRKRTRESLAHILCEPCPTCGGIGEVKTARTVCYEILRELLREARQFNPREFRVIAAGPVIDLFLDEESQALAMLSDFIDKTVSLQAEGGYLQEQYDIVLL